MKNTIMLKKNYQFKNVLSKGIYYTGIYITAVIQKNNKNINYLGIAVGVKNGKATKRNKLKRLIRENYRFYEEKIKKENNIIFLWNKKRNIEEVNFKNIQQDMKTIFDKAKIIKEGNI